MLRKRIFKNLRLIVLVALGIVLGTTAGGLYYLNESGVNDQWRAKIAVELENLGIVADFNSLRYEPSRGLVAKGVRIYSDESKTETVATLKHLIIDVDKTKLMRGKLRVNNVSLSEAEISFPIDPEEPNGPRVIINDLNGDLFLPDKNTIEARDVSGMVAGIQLTLDANIWSQNLGSIKQQPKSHQEARVTKVKIIAKIIEELNRWNWPEGKPPQLKIYAEGNIDDPNSAHLEFSLSATELERDNVVLQDIFISGDYNNKVVTLDTIKLNDGTGQLTARADFQQTTRKGRFHVSKSTLHLQKLTRKLFDVRPLHQLTFSIPPTINCTGSVELDENFKPRVQLTGHAEITDFSYLGTRFQKLSTDISLQGHNLFLTALHATRPDGEIKGKMLIKDRVIRYEAQSSLPASAYGPFIINPAIKKHYDHANFTSESRIIINSKGTIQQDSRDGWLLEAHGKLKNFTYKGVPIKELVTNYRSDLKLTTFSEVQINFDYQNYQLRQQYGGPTSGRVETDKVTLDHQQRMVHIDNLQTTSWPAPVVRLFNTKAADNCEQYRFHRPPTLSANGSFDLNKDQARTDFKVNVRAPGSTHYSFLDEDLTLRKLRGKVRIRQNRVDVTDLSFYTFQGPCKGQVIVDTKQQRYHGEFQWSRLHLKDIGQLYNFKNADKGLLTGRIDFSGHKNNISQFNGKGAIALERGNLFSIPMLGPLSPIIEAVLGKKNPTNEQAENASCTYAIRNGIIYSDNFLANTRSLRFTGEGKIDLNTKQIDLLVRMNARGVFSLISLPLKPFMGLFQFSGKGDISSPDWKTSIFTAPKRGKKDPIFRRPPKARVINE